MPGDAEVGCEVFGKRALRGLDKPADVTNEDRSIISRCFRPIELIEKRLKVPQVIACPSVTVVPHSQRQAFELANQENRIDDLRPSQAAAPAGPAMRSPMFVGADDEVERVKFDGEFIKSDRFEAVREVRGGQLPF